MGFGLGAVARLKEKVFAFGTATATSKREENRLESSMLSGTMFYVLIIAVLAVIVALMFGLSGLARGNGWAHSNSNKLMRWRIILQAVAVVLILIFAYLKRNGG